MKKSISVLLCICMMLSLVACGVTDASQTAQVRPEKPGNVALQLNNNDKDDGGVLKKLNRKDKELVAELLGGQSNASDLSDKELDTLVDQIIDKNGENVVSDVVNMGNKPSDGNNATSDAYDENGAMTKPFDQVYPDLIEEEKVTFSGESILIKLVSDTLTEGLKAAGIGALEKIVPMGDVAWYEAKLVEGTNAKDALVAVRNLDEVLLAEYNYEIQVAALDDYKHFDKEQDEDFKKNGHNKDQWHFHHCGIVDGYESMDNKGGSSSVIVAVIDSGVDYNHEDLKDNIWVNTKEIPDNGRDDDGNGYIDDYYGVDIVAGRGNGGDTNGHGTHVAGIIAARNNNVGVLGIAYNVKIMSVKAAMHNGTLNQADIAKAILYAYTMGAEVINMSFGGSACSIAVQDALATAYTRCVLVASAGNDGENNEPTPTDPIYLPNYPAALTYVLGVMSVDETGKESVFTNWDVKAFNGVEYELYAPGENIMSTLPGNKYGYLSGTSMAAPVVSAFAAILRSEFADRDKYPTKFIYGQLASTSEIYADCVNPQAHGKHNLPQVVDLNAALTKLPKPELNVQDYALFDDPKYSEKNNGDGVIDAGETIALGLIIQNRWGMSENTLVTIDTISASSGLSDPYIIIHNPTVDYGSVGTYSTQDCGKIFTDELLTGWENPFLITITEDCPNDYRFTLNVTITCENALDEEDETHYVFDDIHVNENVRSGYILPSVIEEDMVLTKDNLYIIPNATVIQAGVTVRVEPGTHIQFWSDDANDPYADSYIAYLLVNGNFLVEGTKEDPVYIYPSQLMDRFGVEIGSSNGGYVSLKYADITNFFYPYSGIDYSHTGTGNRIDLADHCTFRNNYSKYLYYRSLSGGVVSTNSASGGTIGHINAKDCVFYKLAFYDYTHLHGTFDRCVFTQCGIDFRGTHQNCVFLDNAMVDQTEPDRYHNSSMNVNQGITVEPADMSVYYRPETGTTYVQYNTHNSWSEAQRQMETMAGYIGKLFGGSFFVAETMEEYEWLKKRGVYNYYAGIQNGGNGYVWSDGTPLQQEFLPLYISSDSFGAFLYIANDRLEWGSYSSALYEIPGQILPQDIAFMEYAVDIDMETTYQITPRNTPVQLPTNGFLYESSDESVITVNETGLVTPVGVGTADVWVYSLDRAIRNRMTFTVRDYVALESLTIPAENALVAVGENLALNCVLRPANTTRKNVIFTSSDENVAKVDAGGIVTGISSGTVTIAATCEGLTDTITVTVYQKTTSLELSDLVISAPLSDGTRVLPTVIPSAGAEMELSWRSTDETVAALEDGKLVLKSLGTTAVIVTDSRSGLSVACLVIVTDQKANPVRQIAYGTAYNEKWLLLEDGSLYGWNNKSVSTPTLMTTGVKAVAADHNYGLVLKENGVLQRWSMNSFTYTTIDAFSGMDIVDIELDSEDNIWVCTADGSAYAMGKSNTYGQLGIGSTQAADHPTLINLDGVVDIENHEHGTYLLTDKGELYAVGGLSYTTTAEPIRIATGVTKILAVTYSQVCYYLTEDGKIVYFHGGNPEESRYNVSQYNTSGMEQIAYNNGNGFIGIRDGKVYVGTSDGKVSQINGITDAVMVSTKNGTFYVGTASGLLLAFGDNSTGYNAMAGVTLETTVKIPVMIPLAQIGEETLTTPETSLVEGVLVGNELQLTFKKLLQSAAPTLYADGKQITVQCVITDHNYLTISRTAGFTEGVTYELVFAPGSILAAGGVTNAEEIRIAFTWQAGTAAPSTPVEPDGSEPSVEAPVIYEAILDESIERILTAKSVVEKLEKLIEETQYNPNFTGNVILNPVSTDTKVEHWFRPLAPSISAGEYMEIPFGGNYWGSVNTTAIQLQMVDYTDFINYGRLMYAPFLTEAPENTFPFVTTVKLFNKYGEAVTTVGNEQITFQVKFNRDMDTSIPLQVRFGSAYPYGDYEIEGQYVDARTWEGTYTLNTLIENGNQYFTISNGCSATDDLELQIDQQRFGFEIDTTAAQALIMQGTATNTGIELKWTQDDFATLMGYNVYRSTKEDGYYTRLNSTVIPADTMEWFDDTVEPGVIYYYNFTVVQTDMSESEPSGKIVIMSKDTMAPDIYHSPVTGAFTGSNLVLSATVTDNLNIAYANLYYRVAGTETWNIIRMNKLNDKYSAIIPAQYVTMEGIEYYIEAFDGVSFTYKGSEESPYIVAVQEAVGADALGDVDGDGVITNLDALLLLYTINDKYNMTADEFARADLNGDGELWSAEALRILQYVSGVVGSVKM